MFSFRTKRNYEREVNFFNLYEDPVLFSEMPIIPRFYVRNNLYRALRNDLN
jgi:hypothetical protein